MSKHIRHLQLQKGAGPGAGNTLPQHLQLLISTCAFSVSFNLSFRLIFPSQFFLTIPILLLSILSLSTAIPVSSSFYTMIVIM